MAPVVFDAALDPDKPFIHRKAWVTDQLTAFAEQKQLIALRTIPGEAVEFSVSGITSLEMAHIDVLLQNGSPDGYYVPMWRDRRPLTVSVGLGATVMPVGSTTGYRFIEDEYALLWANRYEWELVTVTERQATNVVVSATTRAWSRRTLLIPIKVGWLNADVSPSRLSRDGVSVSVPFVFPLNSELAVLPDASLLSTNDRRLFVEKGRWTRVTIISSAATGNPETLTVGGAINGLIASELWSDLPGIEKEFGPAFDDGYLYFIASHQTSGAAGPGTVVGTAPDEYEIGLEDGSGDGSYDDITLTVEVYDL